MWALPRGGGEASRSKGASSGCLGTGSQPSLWLAWEMDRLWLQGTFRAAWLGLLYLFQGERARKSLLATLDSERGCQATGKMR